MSRARQRGAWPGPLLAVALVAVAAAPALAQPAAPPAQPATELTTEPMAASDPAEIPDAPAAEPVEKKKRRRAEPVETGNLEDPVFPTPNVRDAIRVRLTSRLLPAASFDSVDVDLYRPEVRVRATAPLSKRAVLQLTARMASSLYDFDADEGLLQPGKRDQLGDFWDTSVTLQGGYRLNDERSLFVDGEMWSVLAAANWRSRWEAGAFDDAMTGDGALVLGYEISEVIRLALGVAVGNRLDGSGLRVSPVATLKWDASKRFTVRNRGRGIQLEYDLHRRFEAFATAFLDTRRFRLDDRQGLPDDLTFRDQAVFTGLGFEWKLSKHFRINAEAGVVAWREIRLRSEQDGTLFEEQARPSPYFDFRLEVRP